MFYVMNNGTDAVMEESDFDGFNCNVFENLEDAYEYLQEWLGDWQETFPAIEDFEVGVEYYYDGYDHVSIEED